MQRLNNVPHTIIGVAPERFYGTFVGWAMNFWVPTSMEENFESGGYKLEDRSARWIEGYLRLKPGVTRAQEQEEMTAIATHHRRSNLRRHLLVVPAAPATHTESRPEPRWSALVIRLAVAADETRLRRLAHLDSARPLSGQTLLAEQGAELAEVIDFPGSARLSHGSRRLGG